MARLLPNGFYVFYFHDISDNPDVPANVRTSPERFIREISYIHSNFDIVRLADGIAMLDQQWASGVDGRYAAISFDDGFRSIWTTAYPALTQRKLPATLFINGAALDGETWLEAVLMHNLARYRDVDWMNETFPHLRSAESLSAFVRQNSGPQFAARLMELRPPELLKKQLYLDRDDLDRMSPDLVNIANHSFSHYWLAHLPIDVQRIDIDRGHHCLRDLPHYVPLLALPYGSDDSFNDDTVSIVERDWNGILIKAVGGIAHSREGGHLSIERIGLNDNKPPIELHVRDRVLGESFGNRVRSRLRAVVRR